MSVGRPRVVAKKLSVGLYPEHVEFISEESKRTGRYEGDIVRDAVTLLIAHQAKPAKVRRRSR